MRRSLQLFIIGYVAILLGGCSTSVPTRYYLLTSVPHPTQQMAPQERVLGLGPVSVPKYLDRKAIVTSVGEHEISISDLDQWGESLDSNIWRVLSQNMMGQGAATRVDAFPFRHRNDVDVQAALEFARFERLPNDQVEIDVKWSIREKGKDGVRIGGTQFMTPCFAEGYSGTVECMSEALFQLAKKLNQDLETS